MLKLNWYYQVELLTATVYSDPPISVAAEDVPKIVVTIKASHCKKFC